MYTRNINISINRILSFLDCDINSPSCGSFDRYYWSWKKKDFQDSTLAYAVLALLKVENVQGKILNMDVILNFVVKNIVKIQSPNGSFDQTYPYENHPKVGLDISNVLYSYLQVSEDDEIANAYRKLIEYSLKEEEKYGVICNHLAHYAYEYLLAFTFFQDKRYYNKAIANIEKINEHTNPEGWHREYMGGDPGYQTRTLRYLTKCLSFLNGEDREMCEELCSKSITFLDHAILPDGTLYSMFGSRNTSIIYPSGIEYMANHFPDEYGNVALRVRRSINNSKAILPLHLEFDNFIRLFDDFLDAQIYYNEKPNINCKQAVDNSFYLDNFGLKKIINAQYSIYIHLKFGGVLAIYEGEKLVYKDSGFLIEDLKERHFGTRNVFDLSRIVTNEKESIIIKTKLFKSIHDNLTPLKMIVLRILNISLLRVKFFSDIFRGFLVKKMITGKQLKSYGYATRKISLTVHDVLIEDIVQLKFIPKRIFRTKFLNLFHMASSRYVHPLDKDMHFYEEEIVYGKRKFRIERKVKLHNPDAV